MAPATGRKSRGRDSDDDTEESRAGTPSSTARNDSKRARRSLGDEQTPSRNNTPARTTLEPVSKTRSEHKPLVVNRDVQSMQKYQPGAIVRVKLTNFVTYTSAEFRPGPSLNMVIGPNGTGKSTLVCAICLGLGWGTQHLGRAKDASEFVKHGCREATIEIELQRGGAYKRNPVFVRKIKKDGNKSTYFLNGKPTSAKVFQDMARTFSIQIDNLCQFLPQDKVVEFAAMTPIELLRSTQQAAAPPEMLRWHEDLKKLREGQRARFLDTKSDREHLGSLEARQEMNRVDVERMREKIETQNRLGWLERCRPIPKYAESKKRYQDVRGKQKQVSLELKKVKEEVQPALKKVNAKEAYLKEVMVLKDQREKDVSKIEGQCKKVEAELEKAEGKMTDCDHKIDAEKKSRQPTKEARVKIQRQINQLKTQMEQRPEPFDANLINERLRTMTERRRELEGQAYERKAKIDVLKAQGGERNNSIANLKRKLEDLGTQAGQQESKLERSAPDTYKAWRWIQANGRLFDEEVFGPPMVSCSLKDPGLADAMESFFQQNDFKIITVQNKEDFALLQRRLLKEMRLNDISLRVCSLKNLDNFQAPMSDERLHGLGFEGWAIDQLNGPPTVLAMLCSEKFLHTSAVSTRDISDAQYDEIVRAGIRNFVAGKTSYSITQRSEYGAAGVSAKTKQTRAALFWTQQAIDMGAKARYDREIGQLSMDNQEIKAQFDELRSEGEAAKAENKKLIEETETLKAEKEAKQIALVAFNSLPAKLAQQEEKLTATEEKLVGVKDRIATNNKLKDDYLILKVGYTIKLAAATGILREKLASLLEAEMWLLEAQSDTDTLRARNEDVRNMLMTKEREAKEAAEIAAREKTAAQTLMAELKRLQQEALELVNKGDDGLQLVLQEMMAKELSTEDLEADIDSLQGKLDLIQGVGGNVVKDYEDRAQKIEKLRARVEEAKAELDEFRHAIREIRDKWEPRLEELVARISDKFGESFARIGCAGEVVVFKASSAEHDEDDSQRTIEDDDGNGLDFANWAIHISVRFRDNEPLSLLDAHRQSGGERAVSTIFYLMALQSLSRAPFRVVDEINQGMDPRNERMVHGRMVDIATPRDGEEGGGSQYFLITPKLLSGLQYRRGMTVLCIVSGENVPAAIEAADDGKEVKDRQGEGARLWRVDFQKFVQRARELGLSAQAAGVGAGGKRVDSGVGLGSSFGVAAESGMIDGEASTPGSRSVSIEAR